MRNKFSMLFLIFLLTVAGMQAQQSVSKPLRIVDTLTVQERNSRNPILLKRELDSLIKLYNVSQMQVQQKEPIIEVRNDTSIYMIIALVAVLILLGWLLYLFNVHHKKFNKTIFHLTRELQQWESYSNSPVTSFDMAKEKSTKTRTTQVLENKISDLNAELHKLTKENESLNRVVKEYNGIQHEFDSLKQGITKTYKIKNYPGYDKSKTDASVLYGVMETENAVAHYAYEKFLKPILMITDANKNNPAKVSDEDGKRLLELLVSLSFLYIEYLYLRINDLAIGGKMVERIQGLNKSNGIDTSLLKKLNTEYGSRALVLRMILDKMQLNQLSYPVFDETDLNNQ